MYCEKCCRIIEGSRCSTCGGRKVREPRQDDPCFLTELDYVSSGILEDVLKQHAMPLLTKNVLGAGLAIRVGPMLDRTRFYVPFDRLEEARSSADDLFAAADATEEGE